MALVLVWAAMAVTDSVFIVQSGDSSAPGGQHATPGASARHHPGRPRHTQPASPVRTSPQPSPAITPLAPVTVAAFGPGGTASGDNPGNASRAIDGSSQTVWQSDWYRSAEFGNLQAGTGLLLDMGHPVRVTSVSILLGSERGADLTVAAERVPRVPASRGQATARDAGGTVRLTLARPRRERYLLIWFTLLPPDSAGTFQASVYDIAVDGTS